MTTTYRRPADSAGRCPSSTRTSATAASTRCSARMPDVWEAMRLNREDESVVVVPSITPRPRRAAAAAASSRRIEERFLFLLLLLRQPRLRMIYVTSHADRPERSSSTTSRCCPA